jgi:hypothetical protein
MVSFVDTANIGATFLLYLQFYHPFASLFCKFWIFFWSPLVIYWKSIDLLTQIHRYYKILYQNKLQNYLIF